MSRKKVLFQGSYKPLGTRFDSLEQKAIAEPIASELGRALMHGNFDLILTSSRELDSLVGASAVAACKELGIDPRERIRTCPHGHSSDRTGFGMVLPSIERYWQDVRTFVVQEADAVIGLLGGKGTSDCLQKAMLAGKPVFPIAVAGGGAQYVWEKFRMGGLYARSKDEIDIAFLADMSLSPEEMAAKIAKSCRMLFEEKVKTYSKRIFIIHGHDDGLKESLARFLKDLELIPVILREQPDRGRTILLKLTDELKDVGFCVCSLYAG